MDFNLITLEQFQKLDYKNKAVALDLMLKKQECLNLRRPSLMFESLYEWQYKFVKLTNEFNEVCLIAANQIGKTRTGTLIDAMHLTGDYPEFWPGYRFDFAPYLWLLGYSMEKTRDLLQQKLFGKFISGKKQFTGGLIHASKVVGYELAGGTPNAMRTVEVEHKLGISTVQFWSYSQGQHALMGDVVDFFHIDEEPKDQHIRPQVLTRTINGDRGKRGRGIYTFTPENGRTDTVIQFMDKPSKTQVYIQAGWRDSPHITPEKAEELMAVYPVHQREMRATGAPMLGHGRIYDLSDEFLTQQPFEIPDHFFAINGLDFGWDHPQAHIQLVEDRDEGMFYVTHAYKVSRFSAVQAWGEVKPWAANVPTAWPPDGLQNEKGRDNSTQLKQHYVEAGFRMLFEHATWPEGGNSVEIGLTEIQQLMSKGKFRIFAGLFDLFEEIRQYHRDDKNKIVKVKDDLLDAVRYAYMMRRYAIRYVEVKNKQQQKVIIPKPISSYVSRTAGRSL